jgi:hypothetical protein
LDDRYYIHTKEGSGRNEWRRRQYQSISRRLSWLIKKEMEVKKEFLSRTPM